MVFEGNKSFLSADELLDMSYILGKKVFLSQFFPSCLIGVWRWGTPVAIAVDELLALGGHKPFHFPVKTERYADDGTVHPVTRIHGLSTWEKALKESQSVLVVDDVWDQGITVCDLVGEIKKINPGLDVRVAVLLYKDKKNRMNCEPDYFVMKTDQWVVFPHELMGLSHEQILRHKGKNAGFAVMQGA